MLQWRRFPYFRCLLKWIWYLNKLRLRSFQPSEADGKRDAICSIPSWNSYCRITANGKQAVRRCTWGYNCIQLVYLALFSQGLFCTVCSVSKWHAPQLDQCHWLLQIVEGNLVQIQPALPVTNNAIIVCLCSTKILRKLDVQDNYLWKWNPSCDQYLPQRGASCWTQLCLIMI